MHARFFGQKRGEEFMDDSGFAEIPDDCREPDACIEETCGSEMEIDRNVPGFANENTGSHHREDLPTMVAGSHGTHAHDHLRLLALQVALSQRGRRRTCPGSRSRDQPPALTTEGLR